MNISPSPQLRLRLVSVLLPALLLFGARSAFAVDPNQLRADLDAILAQDQSIDAVVGQNAAESIAAARTALAGWSDEQLLLLAPYADSIAALKDRTDLLAAHVQATAEEAKSVRKFIRSPGLPFADYYTDSLCTGTRFDTGGLKIAWNVYWAAETAMLAAEFVCQQDILGENTAFVCVPLAIALGVARQVIENYGFCDDDVDSSEIGASYLRLDHVHTDLATAQASLDAAFVGEIQKDLARRRFYIAEFILPAAHGGQLEIVRSVVVDVMTRMSAAGMDIRKAQLFLDRADAYYAAANWKRTYQELGKAYRESVGGKK